MKKTPKNGKKTMGRTERTALDTSCVQNQRSQVSDKEITNRAKRTIKKRGKLGESEKKVIFRLLGMYYTNDEIKEFLLKECGREISYHQLRKFRYEPEYRGDLNKARDDWTKFLGDVAISNKRSRLERLDSLYLESKKSGDRSSALRALSQARDEMEGKTQNEQTHYHLSMSYYNNWSDEEIEKRKLEIMNSLQTLKNRRIIDAE